MILQREYYGYSYSLNLMHLSLIYVFVIYPQKTLLEKLMYVAILTPYLAKFICIKMYLFIFVVILTVELENGKTTLKVLMMFVIVML